MADSPKTGTPTAPASRQTFRFTLAGPVQALLKGFALKHNQATRADYKAAWSSWLEENDEILGAERRRLQEAGYRGDMDDKMYKSGRYYFRARAGLAAAAREAAKETRPPRRHVASTRAIRDAMDAHICARLGTEAFRPVAGYAAFVEDSREVFDQEVARLLTDAGLGREAAEVKLKRTYKNRYFVARRRQGPSDEKKGGK